MAPGDRLGLRARRRPTGRPAAASAGASGSIRTLTPTGSGAGSSDQPLDLHGVLAVDLLEVDPDELLARGRDVLADVVGPDRQLAVAAVDEDREPDRLRPTEVDERVHRGADRPARVQDVVDEDDRPAVDVERQLRALDDRLLGDQREVVAVEGDVERADRDLDALVLGDRRRRSAGRAARRDAGCR